MLVLATLPACGPATATAEADTSETSAASTVGSTSSADVDASSMGTEATGTTEAGESADATSRPETTDETVGGERGSSTSEGLTESGGVTTGSTGSTGAAGICGDGIVEDGEQCDVAGPSEVCNVDCTCVLSSFTWHDTHDGPGQLYDEAHALAAAPEGWFVAVGFEGNEDATGLGNIYVRTLAADGMPSWSLSPDPGVGTSYATAVAIADDGTIVVAGTTEAEAANNDGCPSWFVTAYDAQGTELWSASEPASCRYTSGAVAIPGGFVLVGSVSGMAGSHAMMHAYELDGDPLWEVEQPFVENTDYDDVLLTEDGLLLVIVGTQSPFGGGVSSTTLAAFTLDGASSWSHAFPEQDDTTSFAPRGIARAPDGTFRVGGRYYGEGQPAARVVAWTDAGNELWSFTSSDEWADDIVVLPDSTMLVAGTKPVDDSEDAIVIHLSSDGTQACRLTHAGAGLGRDRAHAIARADDGAVLVAGQSSTVAGNEDFWVARLGL